MSRHAILSASGSHRWLNCTPSARLELEFENTTSEVAREGTAAHALCEHKLKKFLKKRSKQKFSTGQKQFFAFSLIQINFYRLVLSI